MAQPDSERLLVLTRQAGKMTEEVLRAAIEAERTKEPPQRSKERAPSEEER